MASDEGQDGEAAMDAALDNENPALGLDLNENFFDDEDVESTKEGGQFLPDPFEEEVAMEVMARKAMCLICGLHGRKASQIFCAMGCEGVVRAAARDAKAQGPNQFKAFQALRKMGGKAFRDTIANFQARCGAAHRGYRRPAFAWARQLMVISMATVMQRGTECVWLSRRQFVTFIQEAEDMNEAQATQEWFRKLETGKKNGTVNEEGSKVLYPVKQYVLSFNEKKKEDQVQMGCKEIKNPHESDIAEALASCGTDHGKFSDKFFTDDLNLQAGMVQGEEGCFSASSAPSEGQVKAQKLEREAKEVKKAEGKANAEANNKSKVFEKDAVLSTLLPDLVAQVGRVKDKAVETIRKARELIGKVKDDDESKEKFKNALATLEKRNLCLDMATCIDDESTLGSSAQAALHKIKWKDFIQQPSFKTAYEASKEVEPYAKVFQVICLSQLYLDAENPECNSAEEVKEVRKVMKEKLDLYRGLTGKVSEQLSRLKHLFEKTVQVKIDTAATARLKEEEQNKKANMKAAAEAVKQSKAKVRQYSVIDASAAMAKDVKHFTKKDFLALQQLPSHPLIIDNMEIVLADNVQEALGTFVETEFKTSRSYTTSGRGAMMVEDPTQQAEVATQFGPFLGKDGGKLLDQLDRNEKNYINSPWFWASSAAMHACGPEFAMLGSLKFTALGERLVVMAPFDRLEVVFRQHLEDTGEDATTNVTPQTVCDLFSEATELQLASMDFTVRTRAGPGSLLYVPWGWVVCERTINGKLVIGLRWLSVSDWCSPALAALATLVLPGAGDKIKPNSSVGFLQRLLSKQCLHQTSIAAASGKAGLPEALKVKLEAHRPVAKAAAAAPSSSEVSQAAGAKAAAVASSSEVSQVASLVKCEPAAGKPLSLPKKRDADASDVAEAQAKKRGRPAKDPV